MTKKPDSVLIVRLSAIGDVVHTLPVLDAIRQQLPDAKIGWIVEELSAPLLKNHPQIDKLYVVPKKRWKSHRGKAIAKEIMPYFREIRDDKWEAAIDFQGLTKSALSAWGSGAIQRVGFAGKNAREVSFLLYNRRIKPQPADLHVVQQNLRLLEGIGLEVPNGFPSGVIGISDKEKASMSDLLSHHGLQKGEKILLVNPGAGWITKRYPPRLYGKLAVELAKKTGFRPVVMWGPKEEPWRDEILEHSREVESIAAPPTTIREMATLISLSNFYVGGDTGASHMAGLFHVPTLSIFGASDDRRNCPWPPPEAGLSITVEKKGLSCLHCWKTKCPLQGDRHLACMYKLSPDDIIEQASDWLDKVIIA